MRIRILKTYNTLIVGLLTLLGFSSSCDKNGNFGGDEYGVPSAKFIVKGKITSSDTNQAVKGIQVNMQNDTTYTDENGQYQVSDNYGFPSDQSYVVEFKDVDGEQNGEFENADSTVVFKDSEYSNGDGNWYAGETSKELNVKLSSKK